MQNHLHIKFELNQPLDEEMLIDFFTHRKPKAGFSFIDEILVIHPKIKVFHSLKKNEREKALKDFVADFYLHNKQDLINSMKLFQNTWDKVEARFFSESKKIFSCSWPKGKYIGYISMLPCGPRFLENCTFQTCWLWKKNLKGQVIHELLHFQFYNLANILGLDKLIHKNKLWEISEIFNDIVQNEPQFVSIQGYAPKVCYAEHEQKIDEYKKIWKENSSADNFLKKIMKNLKQY
jgi:hypothetical protein